MAVDGCKPFDVLNLGKRRIAHHAAEDVLDRGGAIPSPRRPLPGLAQVGEQPVGLGRGGEHGAVVAGVQERESAPRRLGRVEWRWRPRLDPPDEVRLDLDEVADVGVVAADLDDPQIGARDEDRHVGDLPAGDREVVLDLRQHIRGHGIGAVPARGASRLDLDQTPLTDDRAIKRGDLPGPPPAPQQAPHPPQAPPGGLGVGGGDEGLESVPPRHDLGLLRSRDEPDLLRPQLVGAPVGGLADDDRSIRAADPGAARRRPLRGSLPDRHRQCFHAQLRLVSDVGPFCLWLLYRFRLAMSNHSVV